MAVLRRCWAMGYVLYSASLVCLIAGLMCSESVNFRVFWPDFWIVVSLGLLLSSLLGEVTGAGVRTHP